MQTKCDHNCKNATEWVLVFNMYKIVKQHHTSKTSNSACNCHAPKKTTQSSFSELVWLLWGYNLSSSHIKRLHPPPVRICRDFLLKHSMLDTIKLQGNKTEKSCTLRYSESVICWITFLNCWLVWSVDTLGKAFVFICFPLLVLYGITYWKAQINV